MDGFMDNFERRENALTVMRGCLGTVLMHWDRIDEPMKKTLIETALAQTEALVKVLEDDLKPLRLPDLEVRAQPSSTVAAG